MECRQDRCDPVRMVDAFDVLTLATSQLNRCHQNGTSEAENLSIYGRFWGSGGFQSRRIQQWDLILCGSTNGWERERGAFRNIGRAGRAGADWRGGAEASHGGAAPG